MGYGKEAVIGVLKTKQWIEKIINKENNRIIENNNLVL